MKNTLIIILFLLFSVLAGQAVEPLYITLNGDITVPDQEISGLTWHEDDLILLPQYPKDVIYSIPKSQILEFIKGKRSTILPKEIKWEASKIDKKVCGFEGFEAIVFDGDVIYATIEAETFYGNRGFVISGNYNQRENTITLNQKSRTKLKTPVKLRNLTFETLLINNDEIIALYEGNSKTVNQSPIYYSLDKNLKSKSKYQFPFVEYRITDATQPDSEGKFWVTNYFWPGDYDMLKPELDYTIKSKKDILPVERLLEFQTINDKIIRTNTPPLDIKLSEFGDSRNWEGIVRLEDMGFLIATDKFPGTILAFVKFPK